MGITKVMKYILIFLLFLINSPASTISIPEKALADDLKVLLALYRKSYSDAPVENWNQLGEVTRGFDGINSSLRSGSVTDYFAFVPLAERDRFPKGRLILVQFKAMPWPEAWKTEDPKIPGQYIQHPTHQEIRFLIYEKNGRFYSEYWYETKFQAMLAETGLTVPPPTPYTPQLLNRAKLNATSAPASVAPITIAQTTPTPKLSETAPPIPATSPLPKSPNVFWWIAGLLVVCGGIVFFLRKRIPKP